MLELVNITKNYYLKDQEPVKALKGINLNFRRNEFVAVLGHSGCGKTTLLNIIGGLDKYTSGDLIIEGKSTKNYDDRDWDTYRNHSIGFVFQSYNLIPHQNLLQNVELALTISGISKEERRKRAAAALELVGLGKSLKKKPNQLSGGQMQRVAIARSLVNDPEILLADEPTGALDSETSIQIMDLLKEVAKDRLVIMVTHNPDLANQYANRIVKMSDGVIISDSNPFDGKEQVVEKTRTNKGNKKSSMSFITAFGLSFSNLIAKLKRTILVTIAGSIGIIGVAAVLSVSNGVTNFISDMQNSMLSSYPLSISEESADYTSLMTGMNSWDGKDLVEFDVNSQVGLDSMIDYLMSAYQDFTSIKTNDINNDLMTYLSGISSDNAAAIQYDYGIDVTNNIFTNWHLENEDVTEYISFNGLIQRYIAELKTKDGFSEYASYVNLFTNFMDELPNNPDYILSQYDLIAGDKIATEEDEIMLVVSDNTTLTDLLLAQMGYYDHEEFLNIAKKAIEENKEDNTLTSEELDELYPYRKVFDYSTLLDKEFYYFPHDEIYTYDNIANESYNTISLVLTSGSKILYLSYGSNGDYLTGVYIDTETSSYNTCYLMSIMPSTNIVNDYDVVNGYWAGICGDEYLILNLNDPTSNTNMLWETTDTLDEKSIINIVSNKTPTMLSSQVTVTPSTNYIEGYQYSSVIDDSMIGNYIEHNGTKLKIVGILRAKEGNDFGCLSTGVYYTSKFAAKYVEDASTSEIINDSTNGIKAFLNNGAASTMDFAAYVTYDYYDYSTCDEGVLTKGYANCLNGDLSQSFSSLFSSLTGVDHLDNNKISLRALSGLKLVEDALGNYNFELLPSSIYIYPYDFDSKDVITDYLDKWNSDETIVLSDGTKLTKEDRAELTYSDTIEMIVSIINTFVKIITIALVSFTSLALIVSCFMIAVITYISVMERVKEIGVIRSLGGRKKDVSRLFIAETFMTGLFSGIFGIIMTGVLCIILNLVIKQYGVSDIGALTPRIALIMIFLSVFLNVISGLIPSMRASHQDPVIALRSE